MARTIGLLVVAVLSGIVIGGAPASSLDTRAGPVAQHGASVDGAGVDGATDLVGWAFARFELAHLELPRDLSIRFDPTLGTCGGRGGRFRSGSTGPVVVLCERTLDASSRRTVLHELAHAWERARLSDAVREAFGEHVGLTSWLDHEVRWIDRAGEHLAEVIAWGLNDRAARRIVLVPYDSCASLEEGYELITGRPPPAGRPGGCARPTHPTPSAPAGAVR